MVPKKAYTKSCLCVEDKFTTGSIILIGSPNSLSRTCSIIANSEKSKEDLTSIVP